MSLSTETVKKINVGMGQQHFARAPDLLTAILGSCVAVTMYWPRGKLGAMAHVVLSHAGNRRGPASNFADRVVPAMLREFKIRGVPKRELVVKLTGGASMFSQSRVIQVGKDNIQTIHAALEQEGLTLAAEHVGGKKGRRVTLDCTTGELTICIAGQEPIVI